MSRELSILAQSLTPQEKSRLSLLASKLAEVDSGEIDNSKGSR